MTITDADFRAALPDVTSTITGPGLSAPVDIVRDGHGVPHIRAASSADAFYAQGFVTAQDRLWHMDYDRHRALGRWSEMVGESGLAEDRLMRTFSLERPSKADYEVSSEAARAMLDAYTAGVNAFLETTKTLPIEYQLLGTMPAPWQAWHCIAVYKVRNMLMGTYEMKLWRARLAVKLGAERAAELFRGYPDTSLVAVPPGELFGTVDIDALDDLAAVVADLNWLGEVDGGSNAWVISGGKTASGLPLVAGDSHRALDTPSVYYQTHMQCPEFRVSGYAVPGVPGAPHFSHTDYVGWGMTHGFGDYQDLFIERFREGDDGLEYETPDGWQTAEVSHEELAVRGGTTESLTIVHTRHGPVVAGDPGSGYGLAFSHPGTNGGTAWANTVHDLLTAKNADEAEESLREWTEPVNNFVYADVHGAYGYRYRGRIPVRAMANAWAPVPGWTDDHEWQGQIPFEEMPRSRNPAAGFVVTCNNAPTTADYPHYINTYFAADHRARRVTSRIEELEPGADVDAMAGIHGDRRSLPAAAFVAHVKKIDGLVGDAAKAQQILLDWDGLMDRESIAPTIYAAARAELFVKVIRAELGDMADESLGSVSGIGRGAATHGGQLFAHAIQAMAEDDADVAVVESSWAETAADVLIAGVEALKAKFGGDMNEWRWGHVHHTRPRHPLSSAFPDQAHALDPPAVATHGDGDTPLAGAYTVGNPFVAMLMSVNRYIHDPSDWRRSRWIVPLGASGHPGSPHYADQAVRWSNVETIPQLWDWSDIESAAETIQRLVP